MELGLRGGEGGEQMGMQLPVFFYGPNFRAGRK
jgi:hypothetical protein